MAWYYADGAFDSAYAYTWDPVLHQPLSTTDYREDPFAVASPEVWAHREFTWDDEGQLVEYTTDEWTHYAGALYLSESTRRVCLTPASSLRGTCAESWEVYDADYDADGSLLSQVDVALVEGGFPATWSYDEDGDGDYDRVIPYDVELDERGRLAALSACSDVDCQERWRHEYGYEGDLLTSEAYLSAEGDEELTSDGARELLWYTHPLDGPTGGTYSTIFTDAEGATSDDYWTLEWTDELKTYRDHDADGAELARRTYALERVERTGL